jgi:glutamine synthetase type III
MLPRDVEEPGKKETQIMNGTTVRQQAVAAVASYKLKTKAHENGKKAQRLEDIFGSEVFGYAQMKASLPMEVFRSLNRTI